MIYSLMVFFRLLRMKLRRTIVTTKGSISMLKFNTLFYKVRFTEFVIAMWTNSFEKFWLLFNSSVELSWCFCICFESIFFCKTCSVHENPNDKKCGGENLFYTFCMLSGCQDTWLNNLSWRNLEEIFQNLCLPSPCWYNHYQIHSKFLTVCASNPKGKEPVKWCTW